MILAKAIIMHIIIRQLKQTAIDMSGFGFRVPGSEFRVFNFEP